MLDQDNNFYLISVNILITCLQDICMDILGKSFMLITSGSWGLRALAVLRNRSEPRFKANCPLSFTHDCNMSPRERISHNTPKTNFFFFFFLTEVHDLFFIENQILLTCLEVLKSQLKERIHVFGVRLHLQCHVTCDVNKPRKLRLWVNHPQLESELRLRHFVVNSFPLSRHGKIKKHSMYSDVSSQVFSGR